jgi:hypothetical protein
MYMAISVTGHHNIKDKLTDIGLVDNFIRYKLSFHNDKKGSENI